MEIVKLLKDYSKSPKENLFCELIYQKSDSSICVEKIKNKDFLIQYLKPVNDFIIYTTEFPNSSIKRTAV